METDKNLGDKKWNNQENVNEGFSEKNLPENYNTENDRMTPEIETDQFGRQSEVKRARFPNRNDSQPSSETPDNSAIENKKSLRNRDLNYDTTDRYPHSNPEAHRDRGNFDVNDA